MLLFVDDSEYALEGCQYLLGTELEAQKLKLVLFLFDGAHKIQQQSQYFTWLAYLQNKILLLLHNYIRMIKSLSKVEYYRSKNIPVVFFCQKIEPEMPVRNHLLESLPRMGTEFEKILSQKKNDKKINLELANAHKIIHELEEELEFLTTRNSEIEEEIFYHKSENKELNRRLDRLQQTISNLESTIQKNGFNAKVKSQSEREQHYAIIASYEKKIDELIESNRKILEAKDKEIRDAENFHQNHIKMAQNQNQQLQHHTQTDIKNFNAQFDRVTKQNSELRQKICELETVNEERLRSLQRTNSGLNQMILEIKSEYEHKVLTLSTEIQILNNKTRDLLDNSAMWEKKVSKQRESWSADQKSLLKQQKDAEESWKINYESLAKQKQKIIQEVNSKQCLINERDKIIIDLQDKIKHLERQVSERDANLAQQLQKGKRREKQLKEDLQNHFNSLISETKASAERTLHLKITDALQKERGALEQKLKNECSRYAERIGKLQASKSEISHNLLITEESKRKLQNSNDQIKVELDFALKREKELVVSTKNEKSALIQEYENKLKNAESLHRNECDGLKNENLLHINNMKKCFEGQIQELNLQLKQKLAMIKSMEEKLKAMGADINHEKNNLVIKIRELENSVMVLQKQKEGNTKQANLNINGLKLEIDRLVENLRIEQQKNQELEKQRGNEKHIADGLKVKIATIEKQRIDYASKTQQQLFEHQRKQGILTSEMETLKRKLVNADKKITDVEGEIRRLEQEKSKLHKMLAEKDASSKEHWNHIQQDFVRISEKATIESQNREKELQQNINEKILQLSEKEGSIEKLTKQLFNCKNKLTELEMNWQNKYKELQQVNKGLQKSQFLLESSEKQKQNRDKTIENLKKQNERLESEANSNYQKSNGYLQKINAINLELQKTKNILLQNELTIKALNIKNSELSEQNAKVSAKTSLKEQQVQKINFDKSKEITIIRQQLQTIRRKYEQEVNNNTRLNEEKKREIQRITSEKNQIEGSIQLSQQEKRKLNEKISELVATLEDRGRMMKENGEKLNHQISIREHSLSQQAIQIKELNKKIQQLQENEKRLQEEIRSVGAKLDKERKNAGDIQAELEAVKNERAKFYKNLQDAEEHIIKLMKQIEKTQTDIQRIYEQNDRRIEQIVKETKTMSITELSKKDSQIKALEDKLKWQLQQEKDEVEKIEAKSKREQERYIIEINQKSQKITEITLIYEELSRSYEEVFKELQFFKKKWARMFDEISDCNQQFSQVKINSGGEYRTEDKKLKKIITTETRNEVKTVKNLIDSSQTPVSDNLQRVEERRTTVRNFQTSSSLLPPLHNKGKTISSLMSDSSVVNSETLNDNGSESSTLSKRI